MRATLSGPTGASMSKLYVDEDRYGEAPPNLLVETVRNAVIDLVRRRFAESAVEWSAVISRRERPDIYGADDVGADLASFSFELPEAATAEPDSDGRTQCGFGENVVRRPTNAVGVARYVRSSDRV